MSIQLSSELSTVFLISLIHELSSRYSDLLQKERRKKWFFSVETSNQITEDCTQIQQHLTGTFILTPPRVSLQPEQTPNQGPMSGFSSPTLGGCDPTNVPRCLAGATLHKGYTVNPAC